jgi:hypothetical protein
VDDFTEVFDGSDPTNPADDEPVDSDGDLLGDQLEDILGTDFQDVDSDGDGLDDGEEYFGVFGFVTDPLTKDTDGGGAWDGYEIFENGTNPLDPQDDVNP